METKYMNYKLTVKDELHDEFIKDVYEANINSTGDMSDYGKATLKFLYCFSDCVEDFKRKLTVLEAIKATDKGSNHWGMSSFMMSMIIQTLYKFWIHGDEIKEFYKETYYGKKIKWDE